MTDIEARKKLNNLGLKYDFSCFKYNGSRYNKSMVICPKHGVFFTNFHNIIRSHNKLVCKKCRNEHQQLKLLKHYHGNDYINHFKKINKSNNKTTLITKKEYKFWSKKRCANEALNYVTKRQFSMLSPVAFKIALQKKWLGDITQHIKQNKNIRKPRSKNTKWSKEICQIKALKYMTKRDFFRNCRNAHEYAYKHGFLDEICKHMRKLGNVRFRCVYVYEFQDKSVYVGITNDFNRRKLDREKRLYDTVTQYMIKSGVDFQHKQLTDYICVDDAVKLEKIYLNEYKKNGWNILNKCKTGGIGGDIRYWTYDKCMEESRKFKYKSDFNLGSKGAYDSCRRNGWLNDAYAHMKKRKPHKIWSKKECLELALDYVSVFGFKNRSESAYNTCVTNGWLNELVFREIKKYKLKHTKKECVLIALKYNNKHDFKINSPQIYSYVCRYHWLKDCIKHMKSKIGAGRPHYNNLTKEDCIQSASHYHNVSEWLKNDRINYNTAWRNKWLLECKFNFKST